MELKEKTINIIVKDLSIEKPFIELLKIDLY